MVQLSTHKTRSALAIGTLFVGLLLGGVPAQAGTQAATVERDGDNATAIRDLTVDGVTYDVVFCGGTSATTYGETPAVFTFTTSEEAQVAARAVSDALTAEGGILTVGSSGAPGCSGDPATEDHFVIGYEVEPWEIPFVREFVNLTKVWLGMPPDDGSDVWGAERSVLVFDVETAVFANFTATGTAPPSGNQPPVADIYGDGQSGEAGGYPVYFDGSSSYDPDGSRRDLQFHWDFGDGTTETNEWAPGHTYAAAGTYNVILTVTDADGASDSDTTQAVIGGSSEPPVADAGGPYTATLGVPLQFDGTGSYDPDSQIESYEWDWNDGSPVVDEGPTPTHTYVAAGTYSVYLIVTDGEGNRTSDFVSVPVGTGNQPPVADPGPQVDGVVGVPVTFDGSASHDPDGAIARYDWDYGDGTIANDVGPTPEHIYAAASPQSGPYRVSLTVTDEDGVTDYALTSADIDAVNRPPVAEAGGPYTADAGMSVDFDSTGSHDPDGTITYLWDFGDGNTSTESAVSHTYAAGGTYTVTLTVTDDRGATAVDFSTAAIDSINEPPSADLNGPYVGVVDAPVSFDGTDSVDPDGEIVEMVWSFGDDAVGTGAAPSHTYTEAGVYDVILQATDNDGAVDQVITKAYIIPGNLPPLPDAGGPYEGTAGSAVTFDGTGSVDLDGNIESYSWNFGDGGTDSGPTPDHVYAAGGVYNAVVTVTDDGGLSRSASAVVTIGDLSVPPTADAGGPYNGTVGADVTFDGSASDDPEGMIARYDWDFGDGSVDTGPAPTHAYAMSGSYVVSLTVTDDSGATSTDVTNVTIGTGNLPPVADASGPYIASSAGVEVTFDGTASHDPGGMITTYDWDFGDGSTAMNAGPTPTHTFGEAGAYYVILRVTDDLGAVDSVGTVAVVAALHRVIEEVTISLELWAENKFVGKAIDRLEKAIIAFDEGVLTKKVFAQVAKAVKHLMKAEKKTPLTDVGGEIEALRLASRAAAVVAIAEAEGGKPKHLKSASSLLAKGDKLAAKGKHDKAVSKYGAAWKKARKAAP